ncbi:hypothetical protein C3747_226g41 [Trypanosoma cruzi]|uniref:Endonuclease/exonuclease/phosphatase domain-containing protein n=1 Tax=Trypanosoma cruzi TaxID=5693 RepID=A0A2V2VTR2_TRYCR|nr:hypothetical protein C3747_226g41 [Trypanosoma cruzi]RNC41048.1 hypothetical protein TcCL_NonESM09420 [Trypanosoma cruzi]
MTVATWRERFLPAMTFFRPAVGAVVAFPFWCVTLCRASAWHLPPGDHCCPCISTALFQHLRGESPQPSHSNWSIIRIYYYHSSLRHAAIIAGELNLHHELWDSHRPPTTGGEDFAAVLIDLYFEPANDPAQATRITHRNVSSPEVTAYRVLRVTHWKSTPYIDSDHRLIS